MKLKKVVVKALRRSAALRHNLRQRSKGPAFSTSAAGIRR